MIKAVIFDMDGVLIDTEKWLNIYWQQAAKEAGFHFTREHGLAIRSLATKYTGPYLQKIFGPEFDYEAIRARRKQLMKEHIEKNGIEKKPDVDEILDYLRSKNSRLPLQQQRIRNVQNSISHRLVSTTNLISL